MPGEGCEVEDRKRLSTRPKGVGAELGVSASLSVWVTEILARAAVSSVYNHYHRLTNISITR